MIKLRVPCDKQQQQPGFNFFFFIHHGHIVPGAKVTDEPLQLFKPSPYERNKKSSLALV